jgi:hypothetical protein
MPASPFVKFLDNDSARMEGGWVKVWTIHIGHMEKRFKLYKTKDHNQIANPLQGDGKVGHPEFSSFITMKLN